jgi:hypothetical protein
MARKQDAQIGGILLLLAVTAQVIDGAVTVGKIRSGMGSNQV